MYYNDNTIVFFNGQWVKAKDLMISPYVQSMHYGNAVFEGIRSYGTPDGTRIFKSEEHFKRLLFSAKKMHIKVNYTIEELTNFTYQLLEKNNLTGNDIAWLVPHQANLRIIDATADRMGISKEKVMINIQRYGNTTAATIPLCLWEWESQLKKGDNLVFAAFGGGFTWGATLVKWAY